MLSRPVPHRRFSPKPASRRLLTALSTLFLALFLATALLAGPFTRPHILALSSASSSRQSSPPLCTPPRNPAQPPPPSPPSPPPHMPASLRRYARWHAAARRCLLTPRCAHKPRILVWRCPSGNDPARCAGLGDRTRGVQFALALAIATDRLFLLDWPDTPYPLSTALAPSLIDWRMPAPSSPRSHPSDSPLAAKQATLHWFSCVPPRPCQENGHSPDEHHLPAPGLDRPVASSSSSSSSSFFSFPSFSSSSSSSSTSSPPTAASSADIDLASADLAERLAAKPNLVIHTRLRNEKLALFLRNSHTAQKLPDLVPSPDDRDRESKTDSGNDSGGTRSLLATRRALLAMLFQPAPPVAQRIQAALTAAGFDASAPYVGVHARTGMDFAETKDPRFTTINRRMGAAVSTLLRCADRTCSVRGGEASNRRLVFVAADSAALKTRFEQTARAAGWSVAMVRQKATVHLGVNTHTMRKLDSRARCAAFLDVFADVLLLARAKAIVSTGSGFADAALVLGEAETMHKAVVPNSEGAEMGCLEVERA